MTNLLCNCDAVASDGIPEIDVFVLSADWCIDDILSEVPSLAAALNVVDELVRKTFAAFDSSVCRTIAARTLQARLQDGIARHSAPFYSDGVKRELQEYGVAVTQIDELRATLPNFARELQEFLEERSLREVACDIAQGVVLDSPHYGNFAGYSAEIVERALIEMTGRRR